jgi:hypothetical protein
MSATHSSSVNRPYGVARVCRAWGIARSTYYDWHKRRRGEMPQGRRGPKPLVPDDELVERIRAIHGHLEREHGIRGEGYRKTHARLRHEGVRTGKHRVLRLMREHALLSPTRVGRPRGPRVHDGRILTDEPDVMWGTDATTTARSTPRAPSRTSWPSSESSRARATSGPPRATASQSDSFGRSRSNSSGSGPSEPPKTYGWPSWTSSGRTTHPGSSRATATAPRTKYGPLSSRRPEPHPSTRHSCVRATGAATNHPNPYQAPLTCLAALAKPGRSLAPLPRPSLHQDLSLDA